MKAAIPLRPDDQIMGPSVEHFRSQLGELYDFNGLPLRTDAEVRSIGERPYDLKCEALGDDILGDGFWDILVEIMNERPERERPRSKVE